MPLMTTLLLVKRQTDKQTDRVVSALQPTTEVPIGDASLFRLLCSGSQKYVPTFEPTLQQDFQLWLC